MACLLVVIALILPRVTMVFILLLTDWFQRVFATWLWPVLGFIFLPYTTLAYLGAILNAGTVTAGWLILIIIAVFVDVANWGGGFHTRRRRAAVGR